MFTAIVNVKATNHFICNSFTWSLLKVVMIFRNTSGGPCQIRTAAQLVLFHMLGETGAVSIQYHLHSFDRCLPLLDKRSDNWFSLAAGLDI